MSEKEKPIYYCFHCGKQLPISKRIHKKSKHHYCDNSCAASRTLVVKQVRMRKFSTDFSNPLEKLDSIDDILSGY